jgi:hypothetical protein
VVVVLVVQVSLVLVLVPVPVQAQYLDLGLVLGQYLVQALVQHLLLVTLAQVQESDYQLVQGLVPQQDQVDPMSGQLLALLLAQGLVIVMARDRDLDTGMDPEVDMGTKLRDN